MANNTTTSAYELIAEAWRLIDGQNPATAGWHYAASEWINAHNRSGESNNAQPEPERNTFLPVADLFAITAPGGISISYTADARHASDSRASGFAVQEYVRLERYQDALCAPTAAPDIAKLVEGMSVSVDVSTWDADAGHRYFGTVSAVQEHSMVKNRLVLLVQDAEPNFVAAAPVVPDEIDANNPALDTHRKWMAEGWNRCRAEMLKGDKS
ncbi:hypothetical protein GWD52_20970 [Enterobacteriaceae bacterium 4M9]|nr:hypothetical protein [Enterobacteriaceae bacterium 4M9]